MNLSVGIVGLPNVGKSTLFNALLKKQSAFADASTGQAGSSGMAKVGNYPFTTIEPNIGIVPVPDKRLEKLADVIAGLGDSSSIATGSTSEESRLRKLSGSTELTVEVLPPSEEELSLSKSARRRPPIVPATVQFVDIAGLVKGASEGAGLGNKFLAHIREVSVICHVIRAFEDPNVIREGSVDPKTDYDSIRTELILADLQTLSKLNEKSLKTDKIRKSAVNKLSSQLDSGKSAYEVVLFDEEKESVKDLYLLTSKPELIALNISEQEYGLDKIPNIVVKYSQLLKLPKEKFVVISAKIEAELSELDETEQKEYLHQLGVEESGLERLIKKAYETLGLISFLTAPSSAKASEGQGEKYEVRAWTIRRGSTAVDASGVIHTDFIKNFIKAEIVAYDDFINVSGPARNASQGSASVAGGGWKGARDAGKARFEGRDYVMQEGDVVEFKIGR